MISDSWAEGSREALMFITPIPLTCLCFENCRSIQAYDQVLENVGKTNNKGLELSLRTVNIDKGGFIGQPICHLTQIKPRLVNYTRVKLMTLEMNGLSVILLDVYYDFEKIGIWQLNEKGAATSYGVTPGYIKIKDQGTHDGKINDADRVILLAIPEPDFIANINNQFTFKNWDFGFTTFVRWGGMTSIGQFAPFAKKRYNKIIFDYWTPE